MGHSGNLFLVASMGPQLVSCGCTHVPRRMQPDPCFNGAAARELRMQEAATAAVVESRCFNGAAARELRMPVSSLPPCADLGASMGPQLVSCGCTALETIGRHGAVLQWGRRS